MAVSVTLYDHTVKLLANKEVTFTTIKAELLNSTAVAAFDATHTTKNQVDGTGANEVSGNGWTAGGELLASVAVTQVTTNDAKLDADDVSKTATGGPIGPARGALLYDSTSSKPLAMIDFGQDEEAGQDTDFKLVWNTSGILTFTYA